MLLTSKMSSCIVLHFLWIAVVVASSMLYHKSILHVSSLVTDRTSTRTIKEISVKNRCKQRSTRRHNNHPPVCMYVEAYDSSHESWGSSLPVLEIPTQKSPIMPDSRKWGMLTPSIWEDEHGIDASVNWLPGDTSISCFKASEELLAKVDRSIQMMSKSRLNKINSLHQAILRSDLQQCMQSFTDICQKTLQHASHQSYRARVVCSRGNTGAKCPQWHIDHVPIRWIQSLYGPGCHYVDCPSVVSWDRMNALEDEVEQYSVKERNTRLVDESTARTIDCLHDAAEGCPIVMIGTQWSDFALEGIRSKDIRPCVHKSPHGLLPWQGRVLLTMDVDIPDECCRAAS